MNTGTTQAEPSVRLFMNEDHNAGEKGRHNDGNKDHRIHTPRTADGPREEASSSIEIIPGFAARWCNRLPVEASSAGLSYGPTRVVG